MQPARPSGPITPRPEGAHSGRERLLVVAAVAVAILLLGWYVADYLYVRSLPEGLDRSID